MPSGETVIDKPPPQSRLLKVRLLLWALVAVAVIGAIALYIIPRGATESPPEETVPAKTSFGGPFTLVGADGKPFSSQSLAGKPYALYFGFTRCGDVCPTTLSRLVKLRRTAANDQAMHIVFITIDPANDGPAEVGQYATLFNAPIIGLTGSQPQIDQVKKQFGIFAQAVPNAPMGQQMEHTATVLLFDREGQFAGTITPDEPDSDALAQIKKLTA
jgi:protein SCO1/2